MIEDVSQIPCEPGYTFRWWLDKLPQPMEEEFLRRARAGQIYGGNADSFLNSL